MNLEQRIVFIKENLLDKGGYTIAAKECLGIIEHALRQLLLRHLAVLPSAVQQRIQQEAQKTAKGSRASGIEDFTMGQLLGLIRTCDFINEWGKVTGRDLINIRMINLDSLSDIRNPLIHNGAEADSSQAFFLFSCVRLLLENFGIESLEGGAEALPDLATLPVLDNPYQGLAAFQEENAQFFCGRSAEIADLQQLVSDRAFVAVLGNSGSGKSSLVFAGLVPALKQAGGWLVMACRPLDQPLYQLAVALMDGLYQSEVNEVARLAEAKALAKSFAAQDLTLDMVIQRIASKYRGRVLLVLDQFEELYTLNDAKTQQQFLALLLPFLAQQAAALTVTVLVTLRADFLGAALADAAFAAWFDGYRNKMLGNLNAAGLQDAVTVPAQKLGVGFESGLPERIVRDVGTESGSLPLLQFALHQLWGLRQGQQLTHANYEALGTVTAALANYAEVVYGRFSAEGQAQCRYVLVQLVRPGLGTADTRRVVAWSRFSLAQQTVLQQLAGARLVVLGRDVESGQEMVEVVHEALIYGWVRLREWMAADREFRLWQEGLWRYLADGVLLSGTPLSVAESFLAERSDFLAESERDFIVRSVAERDRALAEQARQRRVWATFVMAFFVVAVGLSGVAWWFWGESVEKAEEAKRHETESQKNLAQSKENLTTSIRNQSLMLY
ncbi:ATP-binding protein [Thioflexithrix psekupsensis]|uniref:Novel STAND NTPase 1 domain-containing protein n=1 Tax=Thioflexithrix psekupsensis TaxID=1570016 RepID=A0A251X9W0_9GAMM|nr:ATP-binding protein [Thioflexithrix psekupsensis]OUD15222.1 hypothetical protein TPSD3_01445 [Thioflexithrix psekupsensis]